MFIRNFLGIYERPSIAETLKTIRQKHDESLWDYVKHFYNARSTIPYIQDIEIMNAFCDSVSNLKTVEEITMKKLKMVADLLASADICIEASEARARLLKSRGKGTSRKEDHEVNTANRGDVDHLAWIASSKAPTPQDVIVERLSKPSVKPEESISKAEPELMIIDEPAQ
jgi:hydroxypyruvate isomerase